jgi:hypothetical protein
MNREELVKKRKVLVEEALKVLDSYNNLKRELKEIEKKINESN